MKTMDLNKLQQELISEEGVKYEKQTLENIQMSPLRLLSNKQLGESCKNLAECIGDLLCCKPPAEYDEGICKPECIGGNQNLQGEIGVTCENQANCKSDLICCRTGDELFGSCKTVAQCPSSTSTLANEVFETTAKIDAFDSELPQ